PPDFTTRWHGTNGARLLRAHACPAARMPRGLPAIWASSRYETASPLGTVRRAAHARCVKGPPSCSAGTEPRRLPSPLSDAATAREAAGISPPVMGAVRKLAGRVAATSAAGLKPDALTTPSSAVPITVRGPKGVSYVWET